MPLEVKTAMDYRREFVLLADQPDANIRALCRRYQYSSRTGYKWLARYRAQGLAGLEEQSRRPRQSPSRTDPELEETILTQRDAHPTWGGRKLHAWLRAQGMATPPAPSTITAILRRYDRLRADPPAPQPWQRFEHPRPNDLWQMDFMGHRPLVQGRVHPLTILDDHSRFGLCLAACANQQHTTVQAHLTACFRHYGVPSALLLDNGPPWGTSGQRGLTRLEGWLLRLGIRVRHGRIYHPQTQGKIERWHRTIAADIFHPPLLPDLPTAQQVFDRFRLCYNTERPHQALAMAVPGSRYQPSDRVYPEILPELIYDEDDTVRIVSEKGAIQFRGSPWFVSEGLAGQPVALRPTTTDGVYTVRFARQAILTIDLHTEG
jgi:transposase InsO family protein